MRAVILAGGKGTRLRPYTVSLPKPLVPVGDRPVLETILAQLKRTGFERVTISTGHLAGLIEAYFGDGKRFGIAIDYVFEDVPLNTAGALKLLPDIDEDLLVMNGDVLTDLDFAAFLAGHTASGAVATAAAFRRTSRIDFGVLESDEAGKLVDYIEKPEYHFLVSMGVNALSPGALEHIAPGEALGMPDLMLRLRDAGDIVRVVRHEGYWLDIGRPEDLERAQVDFDEHREWFA
jgi:NDP-sugar pyrophosphorylase family protein